MRENMQELHDYSETRYFYEHGVLPKMFYDKEDEIIKDIIEDGSSFFCRVMALVCEEAGQEMRYTEGQYKVVPCKTGKGYSMIRIEMPVPEEQRECYQVYLVFSDDYQRRRYFTVERGDSPEVRFLCAWGADGGHYNYGFCTSDIARTEKKIIEIFTNKKPKYFVKRREVSLCMMTALLAGIGIVVCARKRKQRWKN